MNSATIPRPNPPKAERETQHNVPNAALHGASSAFGKPSVKPKPLSNTHTGHNGALAAATLAGKGSTATLPRSSYPRSPAEADRKNHPTGSITTSPTSSLAWTRLNNPSILEIPSGRAVGRSKSPSNIAATLAAARYTPSPSVTPRTASPSKYNTVMERRDRERPHDWAASASKLVSDARGRKHERLPFRGEPTALIDLHDGATDSTPIAPTNSLVEIFERNSSLNTKPQQTGSLLKTKGPPPPIKSPKPQRKFQIPSSPLPPQAQELNLGLIRPKIEDRPRSLPSETVPSLISTKERLDDASSSASYVSAPEHKPEVKNKPDFPPPRRAGRRAIETGTSSATKHSLQHQKEAPAPLSASSSGAKPVSLKPSNTPVSPPQRPPRPRASTYSSYHRTSLKQLVPHMTGDSLADAIVASSIASSRGPSPSKSPAPPLPRRHYRSLLQSRTPSPTKPRSGTLRKTLRKDSSSSSESSDELHKKAKRYFRKHPNKHHEGTRKRWRDTINEQERKRYEGVWAANKGMHLHPHEESQRHGSPESGTAAQDDVLNLIVRDIWSRSRLPPAVLEEVWDLVDVRGVGRLAREEFVVGLWLIDQRLKGRKLPVRVSESVWTSVRGVGVRVKVRP